MPVVAIPTWLAIWMQGGSVVPRQQT